MQTRSLAVAGMTARIRTPFPGELGGLPPVFGPFLGNSTGEPCVTIDLEHAPELASRPDRPDHPQFSRWRVGDRLRVERADAEGELELAASPLRARFRVPDNGYSVEACVRVALSLALPRRSAMILHGSAVCWGEVAHAFCGVSGAGKSTISRLLAARDGCARLADDLLIVAREDSGWVLHVPPFLGVDGLPRGARAPLASIDLIAQAASHRRIAMPTRAALRELLRHVVVYAAEPTTADLVLDLALRLVTEVPVFRLEFANAPSVGDVLLS